MGLKKTCCYSHRFPNILDLENEAMLTSRTSTTACWLVLVEILLRCWDAAVSLGDPLGLRHVHWSCLVVSHIFGIVHNIWLKTTNQSSFVDDFQVSWCFPLHWRLQFLLECGFGRFCLTGKEVDWWCSGYLISDRQREYMSSSQRDPELAPSNVLFATQMRLDRIIRCTSIMLLIQQMVHVQQT